MDLSIIQKILTSQPFLSVCFRLIPEVYSSLTQLFEKYKLEQMPSSKTVLNSDSRNEIYNSMCFSNMTVNPQDIAINKQKLRKIFCGKVYLKMNLCLI